MLRKNWYLVDCAVFMSDDGGAWEIVSSPESFEGVRDAVKGLGVEPASAEVAMIPQNYVKLQGKDAQVMLKLMATGKSSTSR